MALARLEELLRNQTTGSLSGDLSLVAIAAMAAAGGEDGESLVLEGLSALLEAHPTEGLTPRDVANVAYAISQVTSEGTLSEDLQHLALEGMER